MRQFSSSLSSGTGQSIAVVGSGISGLSAAWLLSHSCSVTLYEKDDRPGGHSNTVETPDGPVDTGFIVYNEKNYPNLTALFNYLGVQTDASDMSFGVSVDRGRIEYAGRDLAGLFVQKTNLLSPSFLRMVYDILRFYRETMSGFHSPALSRNLEDMTLGDFLTRRNYSQTFINQHIVPMGAAIWSTPAERMMEYPLQSFVTFCANHGLLQTRDRPQWRTVSGGSRSYVNRLLEAFEQNGGKTVLNSPIRTVTTTESGVRLETHTGQSFSHDQVVLACHGDQALSMIDQATDEQKNLLSAFSYQRNRAILHTDSRLMPKRRKAWCSWNYLHDRRAGQDNLCVTYWMNSLQRIPARQDYFVTLNPDQMPEEGSIVRSFLYDHPLFNMSANRAQKDLWSIQGQNGLWFCGSYLGYGFHEDGLQSGLAVAEVLGATQRPWKVRRDSDRVNLPQEWLDRLPSFADEGRIKEAVA
ncbi:NAD(P)/FAD-dependent oxidoreductase [Kiloniella sp. b19]|uniref:NAD(P)/FAD-dependent oxidoreductase n=1 Tax=Kiloniella sp. GXU_MW_B19 TaxID=3141326 RepID=UPI0031DCA1D7